MFKLAPSIGKVLLVMALGPLAGCEVKLPRTVGLAERCAGIMKAAMPFAEIDTDKLTSQSTSIDRVVARVEGHRTDLPKDAGPPPSLGAECEFTNNVLTAFRWTEGGPQPRP